MSKASHARRVRVQIGSREVVKLSEVIRAAFARRRALPADLDDVQQDAALEVLLTLKSGRVDPDENPGAYLYRAGMRAAGAGVLRALSCVSLTRYALSSAGSFQHREPIDGCGFVADDTGTITDGIHVQTLAARAPGPAPGVASAVRDIVADHLAPLARDERTAVGMLLGIGGPAAVDSREVQWRTKIGPARTRAALAKVCASVQTDPRWQVIHDMEEST